MAKNEKNKKITSEERFNTEFWKEQRRKTLIESTGASVRLSGSKVTNKEVEKIIEANKKLVGIMEQKIAEVLAEI